MQNADLYQAVTESIIRKLEEGCVPWRKTWSNQYPDRYPTNLVSGKAYRGINTFLLSMQGYACPYWLTFKQAKQLGGTVKKGEKSTLVVFWKPGYTITDKETGEARQILLLRYYRVFNLEQCEGIKIPAKRQEIPVNEISETVDTQHAANVVCDYVTREEVEFTVKGSQPCYVHSLDAIQMPQMDRFESKSEYYSVCFHEMVHSTGHESRLNRELAGMMEIESYSKEELTAEMGAAFLAMETGIQSESLLDNSAAYIKGWLKRLKDDPKFVMNAASHAQKAVDLILDRKYGEETEEAETLEMASA